MAWQRIACLWVLAGLAPGAAVASSGNPPRQVIGVGAGVQLVYRSCGCADACWVAVLEDAATRRPKARLRCDCTSLSFQRAGQGERPLPGDCASFGQEGDKAGDIRRLMARHAQRRLRAP